MLENILNLIRKGGEFWQELKNIRYNYFINVSRFLLKITYEYK